jgi:hypothetical protein
VARTTAQLESWIVRGSTTAGVPAWGEPEANGPNGRRGTETGDRVRSRERSAEEGMLKPGTIDRDNPG